jgi:flagellar hook-associated protein 2
MGIIGGGVSINGPSGIDTASLVEQLTALEQQKVTDVQKKATDYKTQISAYGKLQTALATIQTAAKNLNTASSFDLFKSDSTNSDIVTLTGGAGAIEGNYDIRVAQIAGSEKMISKNGLISSQTASLSSLLSITVGDISIDGTTISIGAGDTIQDLRMKINNATDADGKKLNVSASVIQASTNNYRLVLTSKTTGSDGIAYKDISGDTLQKLGIVDSLGDKGNTAQTISSAGDIETAFGGLAVNSTITYAGTDHNGNAITDSFTKTAGATISDFVAQVKQSFLGTVDVSVVSGNLIITDKTAGSSKLALTTLSTTDKDTAAVTSYATAATVIGKAGAGVMSVGRDAFYSLDGLTMTSADNSVEDVIAGTTVELHKASAGETVPVTLTRDTDAIKAKIQKLVDAYNALQTFVTDETKRADPNDSTSTAGELSGDSTVKDILNRVRQQLMQPSAFSGEAYNSLTMIGVKTDPSTGQMSIDDTQFTKAITTSFDEVENFFVTTGAGDNSNITLGRKTSATQSGIYNLRETDGSGAYDTNYLSIQLAGNAANPWYTSDTRNGDIVTFSSGPVTGLSLTSPAGTIGSGNTSSYTFSVGLGDGLNDLITSLTDARTGVIALHETSLNDQITETNKRADELQTRVDGYHDRLVKQFAAMEQALQTMKTQESNMLSALGLTSSSS